MKKILKLGTIICVVLLFAQCTKDKYLIERNSVGLINNTHTIADVKQLFANDSLVVRLSEGDLGGEDTKYIQEDDQYLVFSKEGKHLLTIVPKKQLDSTSKIKYVEIKGRKYKTDKDITLSSPFKTLNATYNINKVETTLSSATLYIDELNATISMRKKDLGVNEFSTRKVRLDQIPDMTSIDHFTIWFD